MPSIDVTDVLNDTDVAGEPFAVIRRDEMVNNFGESVLVDRAYEAFGSITPTGDNSLVREEAYTQMANAIQVVTIFRLRGPSRVGASGGQPTRRTQPDLVIWNGNAYVVRVQNDYSRYGVGMIQAECVQINYTGTPPFPLPGPLPSASFGNPANAGLVPVLWGLPGCNSM